MRREHVCGLRGLHHALCEALQLQQVGGVDARVIRRVERTEPLREQDAKRVAERAKAFLSTFLSQLFSDGCQGSLRGGDVFQDGVADGLVGVLARREGNVAWFGGKVALGAAQFVR